MTHKEIKEQWYDEFMELLWEYHTCDWKAANSNPDYPFQLAVAYFDWELDSWGNAISPENTPQEAFEEYLKGQGGW